MEDVLNTVNINDVFLAPDGRRVAVALSQRPRGEDASEQLAGDPGYGERRPGVHLAGARRHVDNFQWLRNSRRFSFSRDRKELTELCLYDLDDHSCRTILAGHEELFRLLVGRRQLLPGLRHRGGDRKRTRRTAMSRTSTTASRFPEQRQALTLFVPDSGVRQPLTAAADNFTQVRISPDGRTLLLAAYSEDAKVRPYHKNTLVLVFPGRRPAGKDPRRSLDRGFRLVARFAGNCSCWAAPRRFPAWAAPCPPAWSPTILTSRPTSST